MNLGLSLGITRPVGVARNANLLPAPPNWSDASWQTSGTVKSVTGDQLTLNTSATTSLHVLFRAALTVPAGEVVTASIEAKAGAYGFFALSLHNGATTAGNESIQVFNLTTGAKASFYNTAPFAADAIDAGGGWWRVWMSFAISTTTANPAWWPLDSDRAPRTAWAANGSGVLLRSPKLEVGALSPY